LRWLESGRRIDDHVGFYHHSQQPECLLEHAFKRTRSGCASFLSTVLNMIYVTQIAGHYFALFCKTGSAINETSYSEWSTTLDKFSLDKSNLDKSNLDKSNLDKSYLDKSN